MRSIGESIVENIKFISKVGGEIEALSALIKTELNELLTKDEISNFRILGQPRWKSSESMDENGWTYIEYAHSIPLTLKGKGHKKPKGFLSFQISLFGKGINAVNNQEPLIHINFYEYPIDFEEEEEAMMFPLPGEPELRNDFLFCWEGQSIIEWTYSLLLTSLNSLADVRNKIVEPVKILLNTDLEKGVAPNLDIGELRYQLIDNGEFQFKIIGSKS